MEERRLATRNGPLATRRDRPTRGSSPRPRRLPRLPPRRRRHGAAPAVPARRGGRRAGDARGSGPRRRLGASGAGRRPSRTPRAARRDDGPRLRRRLHEPGRAPRLLEAHRLPRRPRPARGDGACPEHGDPAARHRDGGRRARRAAARGAVRGLDDEPRAVGRRSRSRCASRSSDGAIEVEKTILFRPHGLDALTVTVKRDGQALPCRLLWGPGIGTRHTRRSGTSAATPSPHGVALLEAGKVKQFAAAKLPPEGRRSRRCAGWGSRASTSRRSSWRPPNARRPPRSGRPPCRRPATRSRSSPPWW